MANKTLSIKGKIRNVTKNINLLKKSVFSLLNNNATLRTLLGGTYRIYHQYPPKTLSYPHVIYEIITDMDSPYDEDNATGEITETIVNISIFSNQTGSTESDNIEAQIKYLLHKKNIDLTNSDIICYSCLRTGLPFQRLDEEFKIWLTSTRYKITWATKA